MNVDTQSIDPAEWRHCFPSAERDEVLQHADIVSNWGDFWQFEQCAPDWLNSGRVGPFILVQFLGHGSCSSRILAIDSRDQTAVVIKLPSVDCIEREDTSLAGQVRSIANESRILRHLEQFRSEFAANELLIPEILSDFILQTPSGSVPCVVTRYIPFLVTLDEYLRRSCDSLVAGTHCLARYCELIQRIHDAGVIHADLHFRNLAIQSANDSPAFYAIVDFGAAEIPTASGTMRYRREFKPALVARLFEHERAEVRLTPEYDVACFASYALHFLTHRFFTGTGIGFQEFEAYLKTVSHGSEAQLSRINEVSRRCTERYPYNRPATMNELAALIRSLPSGPLPNRSSSARRRFRFHCLGVISHPGTILLLLVTAMTIIGLVIQSERHAVRQATLEATHANIDSLVGTTLAMTLLESLRELPPEKDRSAISNIERLAIQLKNTPFPDLEAREICCDRLLRLAWLQTRLLGFNSTEELLTSALDISDSEESTPLLAMLHAEALALRSRQLSYNSEGDHLKMAMAHATRALELLEGIDYDSLDKHERIAFERAQSRLGWQAFKPLQDTEFMRGSEWSPFRRLFSLTDKRLQDPMSNEERYWRVCTESLRAYCIHKAALYFAVQSSQRGPECRERLFEARKLLRTTVASESVWGIHQSDIDYATGRIGWVMTMSLTYAHPENLHAAVQEGQEAFVLANSLRNKFPGERSILRWCIDTGWDYADACREYGMSLQDGPARTAAFAREVEIRENVIAFCMQVFAFDRDSGIDRDYRVNATRLAYRFLVMGQFDKCREMMQQIEDNVTVADLSTQHSTGTDSLLCIACWGGSMPGRLQKTRLRQQLEAMVSRKLSDKDAESIRKYRQTGVFDGFMGEPLLKEFFDKLGI